MAANVSELKPREKIARNDSHNGLDGPRRGFLEIGVMTMFERFIKWLESLPTEIRDEVAKLLHEHATAHPSIPTPPPLISPEARGGGGTQPPPPGTSGGGSGTK